MNFGKIKEHKSWLTSATIAIAIVVWLLSGRFISTDDDRNTTDTASQAGNNGQAQSAARTSVRVREQVAEEVTRTISVNGRTAPARTVELNAETDGRVVELGVERGDRLQKGNVIVRLDQRDRLARLRQAEATVKQRELEFDARKSLEDRSYVSEAQVQEAAAMLEAANAELARAKLDIDYMTLRAPFDGALQERMVEVGDFVKAGDPVATFVDEHTIIVSANVSEFDANRVHKGQNGHATLATGEEVDGVIRYVAPVADEATRTFLVELAVENPNGEYRAGVTAELEIPTETILAHKVSPSLLTLDDEGNLGIKTINDAGEVEFHPADVALSSSDGIWLAGLPTSATIITVGQGFVTPGSVVNSVSEVAIDAAVAAKSNGQDKSK